MWSRWRCPACDSLLGISAKHRLLAVLPAILFVMFVVLNMPSWGIGVTAPLVIAAGMVTFMIFERIVVHERCGFLCKGCGYDLRGQVAPTCPECGRQLDEEEIARLKLASPEAVAERVRCSGRFRRWSGVAVITLVAVLVGVQIFGIYKLRARRPTPAAQTQLVVANILAHTRNNAGRAPEHALQHADGGSLHFLTWDSSTTPAAVPVPGGDLATFDDLDESQQAAAAQAAAQALPQGTIAHRVGDYVFTYHGIDFTAANPGLWVVIQSPDPGRNARPAIGTAVYVGCVDGVVLPIQGSRFETALVKQNALRAAAGLAPLPDPHSVTHQAPAVAGP
ncbi:MAG: hypothetical protein KAS72_12860 [Phycisphaerales bacterium]|nr:hypothetical protein [Phycisphaerales bacterium]